MNLDLSNLGTPEVIAAAVIGLLVLFAGYRIKKLAFFLIWFVIGFYLTTYILPYLGPVLPAEIVAEPLYQTLLPLGGSLLLALLGFSIEKFCVSAIAFALVMLITVQYFGTEIQILAAGGIIGIVAAGVATLAIKPAVIVATSAVGAYTITLALLLLIPGLNREIVYFPSLAALTVLGTVTQFLTTKHVK